MGICIFVLFLFYKESPNFTVFYQPQDEKVAREVIKFAEQELPQIVEDIGLKEKIKIDIYIAFSETEIKKIRNFPDWGIGCAYPSKRTIILKSPRIVKYPLNLRTLVAHEIAHVVLGNLLKNIPIPKWFDEGMAMYESREWKIGESIGLSWANFTNSLLPLSEIEQNFPYNSKEAKLAYIESFSAIAFIINEFGKESLQEIIKNTKQTNSFNQALTIVLGLNYQDFKNEWEKWVKERYTGFNVLFKTFFPWTLILIIFFIALFLNIKRKQRYKKKAYYEPTNYTKEP
ncbi:hypothetical protein KAW65_03355 [candidate division WOR-3 bacterium]|nr:hypothetical protein [candidate division WOR-3 bacterium]